MTVKELLHALKERGKGKDVWIKSDKPEDVPAWVDLVLGMSQEKAFFSLRKTSEGMMRKKEESSKKVLDYFFEKAGKQPILKNTV
jgi:hypothetical protein